MNYSIKGIRDVTKILSGQFVCNFFSIFYFVVLTAFLSPLELSVLPVMFTISGICILITGLGLNPTCLRNAPELLAKGRFSEASGLIKTTMRIQILLSFVLAGGVYYFSKPISQVFFKTPDFDTVVKIIAFAIVIGKVLDLNNSALKITQRFGKISIISIFDAVVIRFVALPTLFLFGIEVYISTILGGCMILISLQVFFLRDIFFTRSDRHSLRKLMKFSYPYLLGECALVGSSHADTFFIGVFLSPEKLATYYVAKRFFDFLVVYGNCLINPFIPILSRLKMEGVTALENAFRKMSRYLSFALIPPCFLIASISYPLLQIFGGGRYMSALPILVTLSLTAILSGFYTIYARNIFINGEPMDRLKLYVFNSFTSVSATVILLAIAGNIGVAVAKFLSLCGSICYSKYYLRRLNNARFDIQAFKQTLLVSFAMAGIVSGLQLFYYNIFLIPLYILIGVFVFLTLFCRILKVEDIELIRGFLPSRLKGLSKIPSFFGGNKLRSDVEITTS
jgi:O-antigen/teichoic acid export membrane protein